MDHRVAEHGFELFSDIVPDELLRSLQSETQGLTIESGLRFATHHLAPARAIAFGPLLSLAQKLIGPDARVTRSILFDKTSASNWLVPWHQDLTIAIQSRMDAPGWGPWSLKEGVHHVQPPAHVLSSSITLRLHLDPTPPENGALRVIPRSHTHGVLSPQATSQLRQENPEHIAAASPGDVLAMRPLLLHASSKSTLPARRRVLHVEYSTAPLPHPLQWAE